LRVGFVSSMFLFLAAAYVIDKRLISSMGAGVLTKYLFDPKLESYELFAFLLPFNLLVLSIIGYTSNYVAASIMILQVFGFVLGFSLSIGFLRLTEDYWTKSDQFELGGKERLFWKHEGVLLLIATFSMTLSGYGLGVLQDRFQLQISNVMSFTTDTAVLPASIFFGMGAISVVYAFAATYFVLKHYLIKTSRLLGIEDREEHSKGTKQRTLDEYRT